MAAVKNDDRRRLEALRQAITDGAQTLHRGIEAVAVQDASRRVAEQELQAIARGIEILGKAAWTLNSHLLSGSYQRSSFGHRLTSLLDSLDTQAVILSRPTTCSGQTIRTIAEVAEQFAMGGRFAATDGLFSGEDFSPPYLWWCGVQIETARTSGRKLADAEYYIYCRRHHTLALQLLERALAIHLRRAQLELWGTVIVCDGWLLPTSERQEEQLTELVPLQVRNWACECTTLDLGVSIWVPVLK